MTRSSAFSGRRPAAPHSGYAMVCGRWARRVSAVNPPLAQADGSIGDVYWASTALSWLERPGLLANLGPTLHKIPFQTSSTECGRHLFDLARLRELCPKFVAAGGSSAEAVVSAELGTDLFELGRFRANRVQMKPTSTKFRSNFTRIWSTLCLLTHFGCVCPKICQVLSDIDGLRPDFGQTSPGFGQPGVTSAGLGTIRAITGLHSEDLGGPRSGRILDPGSADG